MVLRTSSVHGAMLLGEQTRHEHPMANAKPCTSSRGKGVLLTNAVPDQQTAWTKARSDVRKLLQDDGYFAVPLPAMSNIGGWAWLAATLHRRLQTGDHLLIEYPFGGRKRLYPIVGLARALGVPLFGLVHDLDSLRYPDSQSWRELAILRLFDGLVSLNASMTKWLRDGGVRRRIVDLTLWDYLCQTPERAWHEDTLTVPLKVACCSNLSWGKAGYIYDPNLADLPGVSLDLYGAFFERNRADPRLHYRGCFDADAPYLQDHYHFGLVWDGTAINRCEGAYGNYMRYNNPHKLSLYIALGLPVIVWREAAAAEIVRRFDIGVTVRDLREIGEIAARVDPAHYQRMVRNLQPLTADVRRGAFLRDAVSRLCDTTGKTKVA
jgi:hypothetical protein